MLLECLLPCLIILHLFVAPYTKVEESFNIQATHDILRYGLPIRNAGEFFREYYDHFSFPGVVPRTFVGALSLAIISKPFITLAGGHYSQHIVRGALGLLNAFAIIRYKRVLTLVYCKDTGRWFILFLASQFHVIYYASRTLPNMFAFSFSESNFSQINRTLLKYFHQQHWRWENFCMPPNQRTHLKFSGDKSEGSAFWFSLQ